MDIFVIASVISPCARAQQFDLSLLSQSGLSEVIEIDNESLGDAWKAEIVDLDEAPAPNFFETFNLSPQGKDYRPTRALRCDVVRHLKTPSTYRRLDSYMKP